MKINGQLTWQDYLHAQHLHTRHPWWQDLIWYSALVIVVGGFLSVMIPDVAASGMSVVWDYIWLPIVILAGVVLFYYVFLPRSMRHLVEEHKEMSAPFEYEITSGGLLISNQYGHGNRLWEEFKKWKEDRNFILLYLSEGQFVIIPKRLCTVDQVDALRTHLQENHVRRDGVVTRRSAIITAVIVFWLLVGAIIYMLTLKPAL